MQSMGLMKIKCGGKINLFLVIGQKKNLKILRKKIKMKTDESERNQDAG